MTLAFSYPDGAPSSLPQAASRGDTTARNPADRLPLVRLTDVRRRFGSLPALDGISLTVAPGEILGIIGRSGAGKSTLIRCLNGLERPDSGTVEVLGRDLASLRESELRRLRARIGMIFQHFNLLSAKTVAANVALPLKIAGVPTIKREKRVAELLQLVGLDGKAKSYPAQLSGGQKQRVGIARALAADPALLLSDEATSALDPETTASILALLRDINRQLGLTVVMITHEMSVVRAIAERVVVLERGEVAEEGRTAAVFANPQSEITRRLIASAHHAPDAVPAERLQPVYHPGLHAILRVVAHGARATRPLVGLVGEAAGGEPLVLRAEVDRVGDEPVATLVLAVPDGHPKRITALRQATATTLSSLEVIGYARDPL
jgi:D-methionine transport system ATP-binding protein